MLAPSPRAATSRPSIRRTRVLLCDAGTSGVLRSSSNRLRCKWCLGCMIPSFTRGPCPALRGEKCIDSCPQLDEPSDSQPRACCERCRASNILAHPGRDQGECPVGLHHDQMVLAGEALAVLDLHHLPGPRMERIEAQNLERRTPGIVTLSRPAWASRGYPAPWRRRLAATATRFTTRLTDIRTAFNRYRLRTKAELIPALAGLEDSP